MLCDILMLMKTKALTDTIKEIESSLSVKISLILGGFVFLGVFLVLITYAKLLSGVPCWVYTGLASACTNPNPANPFVYLPLLALIALPALGFALLSKKIAVRILVFALTFVVISSLSWWVTAIFALVVFR